MPVTVPFNGTNYSIPVTGETGWSTNVTNFLQDVGLHAVTLSTSQTVTNKVQQLAAGSAGTPSLGFAADTASGIYQPTTSEIALATGGTQRVLIDSSGNLTLTGGNLTVDGNITATGSFPTVPNIGKNKLHNSLFAISQRGGGPFTTNGAYTLDRWQLALNSDTPSITQSAISVASADSIGDEEAQYALQNAFTGSSNAAAYSIILQKIENLTRLSNKTVTVSFWAAASASLKLGVSIDQYFGTGGSPSSTVFGNGQSVSLTTTWQRFSLTFSVPSISGKTLGTNYDHSTNLNLWYSSGSTNNTRAGSIGVQSGSVYIWGVQLEIGSIATPLEKLDYALMLAECQRFYQIIPSYLAAGYAGTGGTYYIPFTFQYMRVTPGSSLSGITYANCSNAASVCLAPNSGYCSGLVTGTGTAWYYVTIALSADL